jgi:hypothetical protein
MGQGLPDQCSVGDAYIASLHDQIEKKGSTVISGTAAGLNFINLSSKNN